MFFKSFSILFSFKIIQILLKINCNTQLFHFFWKSYTNPIEFKNGIHGYHLINANRSVWGYFYFYHSSLKLLWKILGSSLLGSRNSDHVSSISCLELLESHFYFTFFLSLPLSKNSCKTMRGVELLLSAFIYLPPSSSSDVWTYSSAIRNSRRRQHIHSASHLRRMTWIDCLAIFAWELERLFFSIFHHCHQKFSYERKDGSSWILKN